MPLHRADRLTVRFDRPPDRRDVFELEREAARMADHVAVVASTASLRELEELIDDYESLQHTLIAANDSWRAEQHRRGRSS